LQDVLIFCFLIPQDIHRLAMLKTVESNKNFKKLKILES